MYSVGRRADVRLVQFAAHRPTMKGLIMRYTITLGLNASDPGHWERASNDYRVPADVVDQCRGLVRSRFPQGGRENACGTGWWLQTVEPGISWYAISALPVDDVVELAALLARYANQDCVLVEAVDDTGRFDPRLVDQAGAWSRPGGSSDDGAWSTGGGRGV
jgi:hypothetical protein